MAQKINDPPSKTQVLKQEDTDIFEIVEQPPEFVGGNIALKKYLKNALKYPPVAQRANIEGRVFLRFVVWKDGSIGNIEILKGIGFGCDEEAVRVITTMPKWRCGRQSGNPINVIYRLPIHFSSKENHHLKPPSKTQVLKQEDTEIFEIVEQQPEFVGGMGELNRYLSKNIKYPQAAQRANVSGKLMISFVVRQDGRITDVELIKGTGLSWDEEVVRVIKAMPRWKPGKNRGKAVNVRYHLSFRPHFE
jgi:TonB family protein